MQNFMKKILLSIGMMLLLASTGFGQIISQYVETESGTTPKGIEVWNNTADTLDFSTNNLVILKGTNGGTPSADFTLNTGTLAPGAVIVIGTSDMETKSDDQGAAFHTEPFTYNGDDALVVQYGGVTTDIFGQSGVDPGSAWSGGGVNTRNSNIQLLFGITTGDTDGFSDPSTRFETISTSPSADIATTGLDGFGVPPATTTVVNGNAGWRLLSLPNTGGVVTDISDDTPVQGITGGDNTGAASNFKLYQSGSSFADPASVSGAWGDGFGFALYFFDNTTASSSELPVTLDASGSEPSSDVSVTLNTTASGSTAGSGASDSKYTLVGNPFASNFDLSTITVTGDGIQNNVQFWNDGTSSYSAQDRTTPYIVRPWQGFWVEVTSANSTTAISLPTSGKTASATSGSFFSKEINNRGDISFTLSSDESYDEAIRLSFRDYATQDFDIADASKLNPLATTYATMAFLSNNRLKAVESLPYNLEETVELKLEEQLVGVSGEFTLDWSGLETIPADWTLTFHDFDEGTSVDMREVSEYTFTAEADDKEKVNPLSILSGPTAQTMKSKSSGNSRFGITLQPNTAVSNEPGDTPLSFGLEQNYPNPFNPSTTINYTIAKSGQVSLSVYNLMGQKVAELVNEVKGEGSYNVSWNAAGAASGMYYYRLEAAGQTLTRKMTLIK